ncbi:MAG: ATP-binding protein [Proteobacteria bacterium]|nr:ATP-binding protein [Pseudomonadota bacterium]MBU4470457.1 ATP-binding protein [Pseudomonadota bacterium]MCG2753510.1 ATP-binding protein [Desulfobacteraceae bacterium]
MREILIISGKGGTGKTSITAAFAHLSRNSILCDLDVDAPDLHLVLQPDPSPAIPFIGGFKAAILEEKCSACGQCREMCQFEALDSDEGKFRVNSLRCEGCGVCVAFCPENAITFESRQSGEWYSSHTRFGPLVHAQLYPGEENSGKLVALLRKEAKYLAESKDSDLIISDGPPGIGCPVISSLSGQDLAVIVTEPTPSGLHDLIRAVELCNHFSLPIAVILNKQDLHEQMARDVRMFCHQKNLSVAGELPYDRRFVNAMVQGQALTEYMESETTRALKDAWERVVSIAGSTKTNKVRRNREQIINSSTL